MKKFIATAKLVNWKTYAGIATVAVGQIMMMLGAHRDGVNDLSRAIETELAKEPAESPARHALNLTPYVDYTENKEKN